MFAKTLIAIFSGACYKTVPQQGRVGVTNGALIKRIEPEFDIFITMDSNIIHQQNLNQLKVCLTVLHATSSRYETLQPMVPQIVSAIDQAKPGLVIHLGD
jgi:hypothetical protein